jgi:hypothetical protein
MDDLFGEPEDAESKIPGNGKIDEKMKKLHEGMNAKGRGGRASALPSPVLCGSDNPRGRSKARSQNTKLMTASTRVLLFVAMTASPCVTSLTPRERNANPTRREDREDDDAGRVRREEVHQAVTHGHEVPAAVRSQGLQIRRPQGRVTCCAVAGCGCWVRNPRNPA